MIDLLFWLGWGCLAYWLGIRRGFTRTTNVMILLLPTDLLQEVSDYLNGRKVRP